MANKDIYKIQLAKIKSLKLIIRNRLMIKVKGLRQ
jgi:hypothetical protein